MDYKYTTQHLNDTDVLVKVYLSKKKVDEFVVQDYGDWNVVEDEIDRRIESLARYSHIVKL